MVEKTQGLDSRALGKLKKSMWGRISFLEQLHTCSMEMRVSL